MKSQEAIHQIQLQSLLFTLNWEDPASDNRALRISPGESLMTITSGGCNTLGFLLKDPESIYAIDINGSQNWQMELKVAAIKQLSHGAFCEFIGLRPSSKRLEQYSELRPQLTEEAKIFWDAKKKIIQDGMLGRGRFENFVRLAGKAIRFLQGSKRIHGLFVDKSQEEQKRFYDEVWDNWRMRLIFNTLFNKYVLARRGLKADYFHFDDGSSSFAESFHNRHRKAFRDIQIKGNYFVAMYILGRYRDLLESPEYLHPENYEIIRQRLSSIKLVTKDAKQWLAEQPDSSVNCFALSNICELMSPEDTEKLFQEVLRVGMKGARISFRNLIIPRNIPDSLQGQIVEDIELSKELLAADRSFVYSKVAAYTINK